MSEVETTLPGEESGPIRPDAAQIKGIRGNIVLAGDPSARLAIWYISPFGERAGAWVYDTVDEDNAREVLSLAERKLLVGFDTAPAVRALDAVARTAGVTTGDWPVLRLDEALADIAAFRERCAEALGEEPPWADALPTVDELRDYADAAPSTVDDPVITEALRLARAVRRCLDLWADTEGVRARRKQLREALGPALPVSPEWLDRLRTASANMLPL